MALYSVITSYLLFNDHLLTRTDASCLNHDNMLVDWWFIYRFPKNAIHPDGKQHVFNHEYLYYDDTYSDPSKKIPDPEPMHHVTEISPAKKITVTKKKSSPRYKRPHKEPHKIKASPKRKRVDYDDDLDYSTLDHLEEMDIDPSNIMTGKRTRGRRRLSSLHQQLHKHQRNPLSNTLRQLYEDKRKSSKIQEWNAFAYSDNPPGPAVSDSKVYAHAKGLLAYRVASAKGYWLIHSVPNFPDLEPKKYEYDADVTYGQTFFCLTLHDEDSILNAVEQLRAMYKLKMYFRQKIVQSLARSIENPLAAAFGLLYNGEYTDMKTDCSIKDIVAQKRKHWLSFSYSPKITHFAKSGNYHQDIFACIVTELQQDFKFETWMRGGQRSFCTANKCKDHRCQYSHNVINVDRVQIDKYGVKWREDQDHAKIGCSTPSTSGAFGYGFKEYVCIGDMNRMYSQRSRGGGYICIQDKQFWEVVDDILKEESVLKCEIPY